MKIAIIKTGGKQYCVKEGQIIKIEKLEAEPGATVNFDTFLIASEDGEDLELGNPSLGERVSGEILETFKDDKVKVVKYKSKIRYKKTYGHRQLQTNVKIKTIA